MSRKTRHVELINKLIEAGRLMSFQHALDIMSYSNKRIEDELESLQVRSHLRQGQRDEHRERTVQRVPKQEFKQESGAFKFVLYA